MTGLMAKSSLKITSCFRRLGPAEIAMRRKLRKRLLDCTFNILEQRTPGGDLNILDAKRPRVLLKRINPKTGLIAPPEHKNNNPKIKEHFFCAIIKELILRRWGKVSR